MSPKRVVQVRLAPSLIYASEMADWGVTSLGRPAVEQLRLELDIPDP
ncbi:hypothetical protein GCM10009525_48000 [Streptosporangium amethystogenes subsp. fukuiense]